MYNVDMTRPFPYRDNYRSTTLLAYLNDVPPGGGGETEFMMATPRPFTVPPREGAALVWANCELENVPTIDTRRPGDVWDEGRCMGGAGPHDMAAYSLVRTSHGEYADYHKVDEGDRAKVLAIARKAEAITGLEVGSSEVPFLQHYKASNRFRAHYGE